ncbi:MAG TPA: hypothetical protein PLB47_11815 [Solirubrobacterales bacterium]|nr:hypothetical protein [Solirubrobacterales bacterium]HNA44830.1 hypothetical protein [Solirubrobacterales bacterium]HNC93798.1 hypothetical protein [Solirubrobacterales bacterium]HNF83728.1 hypothetical protein [Solirubrobacterales bacterium]HNG57412.1 hypothetical protein [Solirubrobacterales bacterium]
MKGFKRSPGVSILAAVVVLVLLGGGAATAAKWIDGKRIKPGSVATKQLKNKAVNTAKLRNAAVGTPQLKNGSVTAAKLAPSALTSGPTGPTGIAGSTGATGPAGPSEVTWKRDTPNFLFSTGGSLVFSEGYPLGPAGYLIDGYLVIERDDVGDVNASCEIFRVFVNSSDIQTGTAETVGLPRTTVAGNGFATLPISGVLDLSSPPGDADGVEMRVVCETNTDNAIAAERQVNAVPTDQLIPG